MSVERVVAFLTPVFVAGSAWLSGAVAKYGINLDKTQVTAVMVAGATAALGAAYKWLDGRAKFVALEKQLKAWDGDATTALGTAEVSGIEKGAVQSASEEIAKLIPAVSVPVDGRG